MTNESPVFLDGLDDETLLWKFNLIGEGVVTGHVINRKVDSHAVPITLMIKTERTIVEIPWTSIQTISFEGEN